MENFKGIIAEGFKGGEGVLEGVKIIGVVLLALLALFIAIRGLNFILGFLFKGLSERAVGMITLVIGVLFLMTPAVKSVQSNLGDFSYAKYTSEYIGSTYL